jgi:adenine-specific DNA-methyltransferase
MAKKKNNAAGDGLKNVEDYRHKGAKRKNNPPAKIAAEGAVPSVPKIQYSYNPRLPPVLRFDTTGGADKLPELLAEAKKRKLTDEEVRLLAHALRTQEPWLEWAGKRESQPTGFFVDPVALHIHERISSQAILKVAARQDVERTLFADPEQEYQEAIKFYQHNIDWTNRLILGDSLHVMASLAHREDLAGKVQMIYIDPPYGIKYGSNFQPEVGRRDVKDKEADLTRELEMVKAYRDTWHIGVHSYLTYLRERLLVAKELLTDSGSVFVQISDENLHHVREILDEVFGPLSFVSLISYVTTSGIPGLTLSRAGDYLLWYCKDREKVKYRQLYRAKKPGEEVAAEYKWLLLRDGSARTMASEEYQGSTALPEGARAWRYGPLTSSGFSEAGSRPFEFRGKTYTVTGNNHWKVAHNGLDRLARADYLVTRENSLAYYLFLDAYPVVPTNNNWIDTKWGFDAGTKAYVVQTNTKVIARCILMTTDPGDLCLDPTCGSGTTAYVAEQWGRRWITIDTSRVAIAIARQRLLTSKHEYYQLRDEKAGVAAGFKYQTVPHITLKSIAQNANLDPIVAKHEALLNERLASCNAALVKANQETRRALALKLLDKERKEGKKAVTDADRRRWELPEKGKKWEHWTAPFDTDPDYPKDLAEAIKGYRKAWRAKMDEVNACIAANAEQEELVDQPEIARGIVRVSGPFTVEAVQPPELSLAEPGKSPIGGAPTQLDTFEVKNAESYLDQMVRLLKMDGVRFPDNKENEFKRLERISGNDGCIHADGRWVLKGEEDSDPDGKATVAVAFGPQYGPVTAQQVEDVIRSANRRGYDDLVVAGFSFDGPAQTIINEAKHPRLRIHIAHIRPDVNPAMDGLLKQKPGNQLFTVFGQPRTTLKGPDTNGEYKVTMKGVDIYDPVTNTIRSTDDQKVAAWFLDGDYDGRTFCITQAFFPDKSAWEKLSKALGGVVDPERFEALSGTLSLPFPAGKHKCVAVKVIDPRGNEVMQVHKLT